MAKNQLVDFKNLQEVLQDFAKDIRENYISQLEKHDRLASGNLINSVKTNVVIGDRSWEVTMTLADYWKYVEDDTKPHWPPISAILKWIQIKPVIPRPDESGRIPTPKQLAFLISRRIAGKSPKGLPGGTKGSHDLQITKDNVIPWYRDRLSAALGRDMEVYIRKVIIEK